MTMALNRCMLLATLLAVPLSPALSQDHAGHGRASEPATASPLAIPIDTETLAGLPREKVIATAHDQTLQCEGVALSALLRTAAALPAEPLGGTGLAQYVLVTARDGYRAIFSLAELEPALGNHPVWLVDQCNGKPLDDEDGPLRLIAPFESRPARWVRQVQSITVVTAP